MITLRRSAATLTMLLALQVIACKHRSEKENDVSASPKAEEIAAVTIAADTIALPADNDQKPAGGHSPKIDWDKKIIKTGTLRIEVKNYNDFNTQAHAITKQFGGYIAQEQQSQSEAKIENTVVLKVPVDQFDNAMTALSQSREKIIEKNVTSEDVTSEMIDVRSRMEAKKQVRLRYLDLLKQARNMQEVLQVQNEINDIQEQIESAAGRIKYLGHSSAFSTIQLTFFQVLGTTTAPETPSFWQKAVMALRTGSNWIGEVALALLAVWPLWCLVALGWFAYRKWKPSTVKSK
ncbi:MAG: DUF4349 domain-containing protein [Chitinophagaceae bacterium]